MEEEKEQLSTVLMSAIPALMSKVKWLPVVHVMCTCDGVHVMVLVMVCM